MPTTKNNEFIMQVKIKPKNAYNETREKQKKLKLQKLNKQLQDINKLYEGVLKFRTTKKALLERTEEKIFRLKQKIQLLEKCTHKKTL